MSLGERLDRIRAGGEKRFPADTRTVMHAAVATLKDSGAMVSTISKGAQLPGFSLPDGTGHPVSSHDLLEQGPLVVTFYRGHW